MYVQAHHDGRTQSPSLPPFGTLLEASRRRVRYRADRRRFKAIRVEAISGQLFVKAALSRLAARLTEVMAWLMIRRAVEAGEIDRAEALGAHHRLAGQTIRGASDPTAGELLPRRLNDLSKERRALYARVARLDAMPDGRPTS